MNLEETIVRGDVFARQGNYVEAAKQYLASEKTYDTKTRLEAIASQLQGNEEILTAAANTFSESEKLWFELGNARFKYNDYSGAANALENSYNLNNKEQKTWGMLAEAYFYQSGAEKSEKFCKHIIADNKNNSYAYVVTAEQLKREGKYAQAILYYDRAVEFGPVKNINTKKAECWEKFGNSPEVLHNYELEYKVSRNAEALSNWIRVYLRAHPGDLIGTLEKYNQLVDSGNRTQLKISTNALHNYVVKNDDVFQTKPKERKKVLKNLLLGYDLLLKETPNSDVLLVSKGNILYGLKKYRSAKKTYVKALKINGKNLLAHLGLGHVYLVKKSFDKAIQQYGFAASYSNVRTAKGQKKYFWDKMQDGLESTMLGTVGFGLPALFLTDFMTNLNLLPGDLYARLGVLGITTASASLGLYGLARKYSRKAMERVGASIGMGAMSGGLFSSLTSILAGASQYIIPAAIAGTYISSLANLGEKPSEVIGSTFLGSLAGIIPGALLGFTLGGPVGAVIGSVSGAGAGSIFGKYVSEAGLEEKISSSFASSAVSAGIFGGLLGLATGGPLSALIGASLGTWAGMPVLAALDDNENVLSALGAGTLIAGLPGAILGGIMTGPVGAIAGGGLGAIVGAGISEVSDDKKFVPWLGIASGGAIFGSTGYLMGGPVIAGLGAVAGTLIAGGIALDDDNLPILSALINGFGAGIGLAGSYFLTPDFLVSAPGWFAGGIVGINAVILGALIANAIFNS